MFLARLPWRDSSWSCRNLRSGFCSSFSSSCKSYVPARKRRCLKQNLVTSIAPTERRRGSEKPISRSMHHPFEISFRSVSFAVCYDPENLSFRRCLHPALLVENHCCPDGDPAASGSCLEQRSRKPEGWEARAALFLHGNRPEENLGRHYQ